MELKIHRPMLTDADVAFIIEVLLKEYHKLDAEIKRLEEDYEQLRKRADIHRLSNLEIASTDFKGLDEKKRATKLKIFRLDDERRIFEGYIIRLRRILDGKASKGGGIPLEARSASDHVHRRWLVKKEKESETSP